MIAATSDFAALTQPECFGVPPKNGITTGPALPFAPLWMWDAVGVPIPLQLGLKQTLPVEEFSVTFAVPLPVGLPAGVSCLPFMLTVMTLDAANAIDATARTATMVVSRIAIDLRMALSPIRIGCHREPSNGKGRGAIGLWS